MKRAASMQQKSRFLFESNTGSLLGLVPIVVAAVLSTAPAQAQSDDAGQDAGAACQTLAAIAPFVGITAGEVRVSPVSGADGDAPTDASDAANLQCAVDLAVDEGISTIRLLRGSEEPGVFNLDRMVTVTDFNGTIVGGGLVNSDDPNDLTYRTTVKVAGLDCATPLQDNRYPAAFKVIGGDVTFTAFAIETDVGGACSNGNGNFALIHFTGPDAATCSNGLTSANSFGDVDRMRLSSLAANVAELRQVYEGVGVLAAPEGRMLENECNDSLLGRVRVNRSVLEAFFAAVQTRMQGGAQVDVLFNRFDDNTTSLGVFNSNAVVNFLGNNVTFDDSEVLSYSVWVDRLTTNSGDAVPATNRVVVFNNDFTIKAGAHSMVIRAASPDPEAALDLQLAVTGNRFDMRGDSSESDVTGVYLLDLWNATVDRNVFRGDYYPGASSPVPSAIYVDADSEVARRSSITFNNFTNYPEGRRSIVFTDGPEGSANTTAANIVGPNQSLVSTISDASGQNIILE